VHRLWKKQGLLCRLHPPRKRVGARTAAQVEADVPKVLWALDFQFDSTIDGEAINIASMVDEHTADRC
jgi:putative transposase